jgi:hypothetical protein
MKRFTIIFAFLALLILAPTTNAFNDNEFELGQLRRQQSLMESQLSRQSREIESLRTEIATIRMEMSYKCRK